MKKLLCIVIAILFLTSCTHVVEQHSDFEKYNDDLTKVRKAGEFMPSSDSLGDYKDIRYEYKEFSDYLFTQETMALVVKYSDEEYENRKASLDDSFEFIDAPITYQSYYDGPIYYLIPATEVKRNGFYYRIAGNTCKNFIMVGYSDEQKEISYWFFSDFDLDFIAKEGEDFPDNMEWFLDTYYSLP